MNLAADLALALDAATEAGAVAMRYFGTQMDVRDKSPNNPVSDADLAIDALLKERLLAKRPDYGWLSEETVDDQSRQSARFCWVVDPIDGTRAFIKAKPHFTICIGLLADSQPVLGVVFNPATGEMFDAFQGGGARLNGVAIEPSIVDQLEGCAMLGDPGMFRHPAWPTPWPEMDVVSRNSIAYRMCLVAAGHYDGAIALSAKSDWDLAAAHVIVNEAGALATTHEGAAFVYNQLVPLQKSLVVAGKPLHPLLIDRVHHVKLS
ncbi:3'(2'),5'-bisphosphate nucleotidase CysQ [Aquidulcibacter sp.]|jgi:myo-inositol-1(or 4)-monophosphatase|uniref:3'(2'),5'-bisphosphate nucleotidase CysQ n=1 Tax=Aquidulcibacter sp. TaxID=2052990 RepID=UPI0037C12277